VFLCWRRRSAAARNGGSPARRWTGNTGAVVLGPGTRVIVEFSDDSLFVFYVMSVLNTARTAVDIGGPLTFGCRRVPAGRGWWKTLRRKPQSTDHAWLSPVRLRPGIHA
jgi:hypothetical protein